jgi:hypothetical protein
MTHNEIVIHNDAAIREIRLQLLMPIYDEIYQIEERIKKLKRKAHNAAYWHKYKDARRKRTR